MTSEDKLFSIIFGEGGRTKKRRKKGRKRREKKEKPKSSQPEKEEDSEEYEVIVPPSLRTNGKGPKVDKQEGRSNWMLDNDYFNSITAQYNFTNRRVTCVPKLSDEEAIQLHQSQMTRNSDVGSVIQPSSHTQYQMKSAAASPSSRRPTKITRGRPRQRGGNNSHIKLPAGLSPLIKERLENYYPCISIESSSSALEAIQKGMEKIVVRPNSNLDGNAKKMETFLEIDESRDDDSFDIICEEEFDKITQRYNFDEEEEEESGIDHNTSPGSCSAWTCW